MYRTMNPTQATPNPFFSAVAARGRKITRIEINSRLEQIETQLLSSLTMLSARTEFGTAIEAKRLIRGAVLLVYRIGIEYICSYFSLKPFLAAEDFAPVGRITDDVYRLWMYGSRLDSAMIHLTSVTLAKATVSKAAQIMNLLNSTVHYHTAVAVDLGDDDVAQPTHQLSEDGEITTDFPPPTQTVLYYVWHTENDAKVCQICNELEGQRWRHDDQLDEVIPTPVLDTHPNCRCRLDIETEMEQIEE